MTKKFPNTTNPILNSTDSVNTNTADSSCRYKNFFTALNISSENCEYDLSNNEEKIGIETFEYGELETDGGEDVLSISEVDAVLIEKEFSCDGLYEFDEIDDQENPEARYINKIETTGKVNRFEKANQIAIEVIQTYNWGKENLSLLENVFFESGWGMTRVSIERELNNGLDPEELKLAVFIRQLWAENQQYWISFIHITSNQPGQESKAVYKTMSWSESLRIIRSFNNVPSEEDIQIFVYQLYDDWYCSTTLQRQYKAFFKYLKYRTSSGRGSLPGNEMFSFLESFYQESL
jgi:hypothetical protein